MSGKTFLKNSRILFPVATLIPSYYDPQDSGHNNYVTIARWPQSSNLENILILKRIRDGQFNLDDWTNKFFGTF